MMKMNPNFVRNISYECCVSVPDLHSNATDVGESSDDHARQETCLAQKHIILYSDCLWTIHLMILKYPQSGNFKEHLYSVTILCWANGQQGKVIKTKFAQWW